MADNLLIIRDKAKREAIDKALPYGWKCMVVGDGFKIGGKDMIKFNQIIVACELHSDQDWRWYHLIVKHLLEHKDKLPIWAS